MSLLTDEKKIFFKIFDNIYMSPKKKLWLSRKSGVNLTENEFFYWYVNVSPKSD